MRRLSFQSKLLLTMLALVVAVTLATLLITENQVQRFSQDLFQRGARLQSDWFLREQAARLQRVREVCGRAAAMPRVRAAVEEGDSVQLYKAVKNDLAFYFDNTDLSADPMGGQAVFFRCLDARGEVFDPPETAAAGPLVLSPDVAARLPAVVSSLTNAPQLVAYLGQPDPQGRARLLEVVFTLIYDDVVDKPVGALMLGFQVDLRPAEKQMTGILLEGQVYSESLPPDLRSAVAGSVRDKSQAREAREEGVPIGAGNDTYRLFLRPLTAGNELPPASYLVLLSMKESIEARQGLRAKVFHIGSIGLIVALGVGLVLTRGLTVPVRELVAGTGEIQRGNLAVRVPVRRADELGRLAASFNEMAQGLALKEKYRSVLNLVADREVADELMRGDVALGGEIRDVSVLFCDIRGFTPLTQNMAPTEVIALLNEHMTVLTRVVYEHHGVVDKFVGDLIMAIFGAPRRCADAPFQAATCALAMVRAREELNQRSTRPITIGIGMACGPVVAGCMGSVDRLNYTVLGERVNLASRLCGKARAMEVIIDQAIRDRLGARIQVDELGGVELKGMPTPVPAFRLRTVIADTGVVEEQPI